MIAELLLILSMSLVGLFIGFMIGYIVGVLKTRDNNTKESEDAE